jgi:outer membrane protein TolC
LYSVREQIIQLYCAALLSEKQLETLQNAQKDVQARRQRADEQVKNGTAIPSAAYAFEARLIELEQQQEEVMARKKSALQGLSLLTGLAINPADVLSATEAAPASGTSERPELTLFALQQQLLDAQQQMTRSKAMPRFNAIATLGYARPGLNFLSNDFAPYAILGLNMRWNLGNLYTGSLNKEKQQLQLQQQRISAQRAQFVLQNDLRKAQQDNEIERLQTTLKKDDNIVALREKIAATAARNISQNPYKSPLPA